MKKQSASRIKDEALVMTFQKGDADATGELYCRYYQKVYQKCYSFAKNTDDATDLAQDIFLKVIENLSSFKGEAKFSTWLYAITFNYCTDYFRKRKNAYFVEINDQTDLVSEPVYCDQLKSDEQRETLLKRLLQNLNEEDRNMLILKYQGKASIKELEKAYNLSSSAVKMRLSRAKARVAGMYHDLTIKPAA